MDASCSAENGRVGLRRIADCRPALIILDLMMPDMDGFEFLVALRRQHGLAGDSDHRGDGEGADRRPIGSRSTGR